MSDEEAIFGGSIEDFDHYDWEEPLGEARSLSCKYFLTPYSKKAQSLAEAGDPRGERLFRFLAVICSFSDRYDDLATPYHPFRVDPDGSRSAIPDELTEPDLDVIEALVAKAADPALRSRLADLLWVCRKDHTAARAASSTDRRKFV